jgi:hypothetical protein
MKGLEAVKFIEDSYQYVNIVEHGFKLEGVSIDSGLTVSGDGSGGSMFDLKSPEKLSLNNLKSNAKKQVVKRVEISAKEFKSMGVSKIKTIVEYLIDCVQQTGVPAENITLYRPGNVDFLIEDYNADTIEFRAYGFLEKE